MSYTDQGYSTFLDRTPQSQPLGSEADPLQFDQFTSSIPTDKFDTTIPGNLIGKGITADKITSGVLTAVQTMGGEGGKVVIDGVNNRIIVNDGNVDRVLIGFLEGGF